MKQPTPPLTKEQLECERELLVGARKILVSKADEYVCYGISITAGALTSGMATWSPRSKDVHAAALRLSQWIYAQIRPGVYYDMWMERTHREQWEATPPKERAKRARDARVRWIDWMIAKIDEDLVVLEALREPL